MQFGKPKWAKIGQLGFPKSGKTYTAISIACGLHKLTGCKRPIRCYDTEGGIEYQLDRIKDLTGSMPDGTLSHSFVDLVAFTKTCREGDIVIVDSVTHPWRELLEAKQSKMGQFRGIMSAKDQWTREFTSWYLSSPCHVIICGRAGFIFAEEEDEQTGERKLTTKGTKMKTETELGFEPSLLIEMIRNEKSDGTFKRTALVKGDRFGVIDGRRFDNPTFESFKPFFDKMDLTSGGPPRLDTEPKTAETLTSEGRSEWQRDQAEREIILDEIKGDLTSAFPGQSAQEKKSKVDLLQETFATRSWVKLEKEWKIYTPDVLRDGRRRLQDRINKEVAA